jgi:hypothetical protein
MFQPVNDWRSLTDLHLISGSGVILRQINLPNLTTLKISSDDGSRDHSWKDFCDKHPNLESLTVEQASWYFTRNPPVFYPKFKVVVEKLPNIKVLSLNWPLDNGVEAVELIGKHSRNLKLLKLWLDISEHKTLSLIKEKKLYDKMPDLRVEIKTSANFFGYRESRLQDIETEEYFSYFD